MSNQEILEQAITKAIEGGWKPLIDGEILGTGDNKFTGELHVAYKTSYARWTLGESISSVIFNHDFAKALWGEDIQPYSINNNLLKGSTFNGVGSLPVDSHSTSKWKFHLQQMVLADDPIKYLGDNI